MSRWLIPTIELSSAKSTTGADTAPWGGSLSRRSRGRGLIAEGLHKLQQKGEELVVRGGAQDGHGILAHKGVFKTALFAQQFQRVGHVNRGILVPQSKQSGHFWYLKQSTKMNIQNHAKAKENEECFTSLSSSQLTEYINLIKARLFSVSE